MTTYPLAEQAAAWLPEATTALVAAQSGDWDTAVDALDVLGDWQGVGVLEEAMLSWVDTLAHTLGIDDYRPGVNLGFGQVSEPEGARLAADQVPAAVAWAGQMMAARIADDPATWSALLGAAVAMPDTEFADLIIAFLSAVAATLNMALAAREGRP